MATTVGPAAPAAPALVFADPAATVGHFEGLTSAIDEARDRVRWGVGGVLAMVGARAYAAVAELVPRSGGEYRYLSDLVHPSLGYLAGWTSLLAGFSAPVASNAAIAGPFAQTLIPSMEPRYVAVGLVVLVTALHAFELRLSRWSQNALAGLKVALLAGFIVMGPVLGNHAVPTWTPPVPAPEPLANFMANLVYVIYAYNGWNTAVYAAEEFRDPRKTVPRSMLLAAAAVTAIYLLLNWVLVANLRPETLQAFLHGDTAKLTLGHLVTADLLGGLGGEVMSALVVLALFSGMSTAAAASPSSPGNLYQTTSSDEGQSWSDYDDLGFIAHAPELMQLGNGVVVSAFRALNSRYTAESVSFVYSLDGGATWSEQVLVEACGSVECGYPGLLELAGNRFLIVYYAPGGIAIKGATYTFEVPAR